MPDTRAYYSNTRPEMLPFVPPGARRILEIGCGEGRFSASIPDATERWAIEPDAVSAGLAEQRLTRVLRGFYAEHSDALPDQYFDCVICNDVIEHMTDHDAFLRDIRRKIAPGGAIVGSLPNVRNFRHLFELLVLRDWHYRDSGILDRTHHRFFTLRSLRRSLEEAGYRVGMLQGINSELRWPESARDAAFFAFGCGLILCSLGRWNDVRYLQIGFRATLA